MSDRTAGYNSDHDEPDTPPDDAPIMTYAEPGSIRLAALSRLSARYPLLTIVLAVIMAALSVAGAFRWLTLEADIAALLPSDVPFIADYTAYKKRFTYDRRTNLVVIDAPSAEAAEKAQADLVRQLRAEGRVFNAVRPVGNDPFLRRHALLYLSSDELEDVVDRLARAEPAIAALARKPNLTGIADLLEILRTEGTDRGLEGAELRERLVSMLKRTAEETRDDRVNTVSWLTLVLPPNVVADRAIIAVQGRLDGEEAEVGADTSAIIDAAADRLGLDEAAGYTVRLTGRGPLSKEEISGAAADVKRAGAISLFLVAVVLFIGFRSWRLILASLTALVVGLSWTFGIATVALGSLNLLSLVFAVLFIGLGIDFAIHYALRYRELRCRETAGRLGDAREGVLRTSRSMARPLGLCAVTSAIGFLSFLPTDYIGMAELGLVSAAGLAMAFLATFTVLPAVLSVTGRGSRVSIDEAAGRAGLPGAARLAGLMARHWRGILIVAGLVTLGAAGVSTRVGFDFNSLAMKDPDSPSVQAFRDLQNEGVITTYTVSIPFETEAEAEQAKPRLRALESVADVRGIGDLVPNDQALKLDLIAEAAIFLWGPLSDIPGESRTDASARGEALDRIVSAAERLEGEEAAAGEGLADVLSSFTPAQVQSFERRLADPLRVALVRLRDFLQAEEIRRSDLPEALASRYVAEDGGVRLVVLPSANLGDYRALGPFVDRIAAEYPQATGRPILEAGTGKIVVGAFFQASVTAFVVILFLLWWILRSLSEAVLVLTPLVMAGLIVTAFGVLAGIPFNMANVLVLPLVFGLGVDNGVHLVARWREEKSILLLLRSSTPRAVVLSGATTIASFAMLGTAGNAGFAGMGVLLAVAVAAILIATTLVLPALLLWREERG